MKKPRLIWLSKYLPPSLPRLVSVPQDSVLIYLCPQGFKGLVRDTEFMKWIIPSKLVTMTRASSWCMMCLLSLIFQVLCVAATANRFTDELELWEAPVWKLFIILHSPIENVKADSTLHELKRAQQAAGVSQMGTLQAFGIWSWVKLYWNRHSIRKAQQEII